LAELKVYLTDELDKRFRMLAMNIFGYGRGSLSEAAVEAFTKWCEEHEASKLEKEPKGGSSQSSSDPVARAEERPRIIPFGKDESSSSALPAS
jgi:hypothetical protein